MHEHRPDELEICGFQGVSLLDYPGRVSAVLFLGGCNFRCPFCHNADLVLRPESLSRLGIDEVTGRLSQRKTLIDGVVITGGEPLIHGEQFLALLAAVRKTGLAVKLDTNGYEVEMLRGTLDSGLVDYIAMDVKTSPERYAVAAGRPVEADRIRHAVDIIRCSGIPHEFRTTCVPGIVAEHDILEIAALIGPDARYYLQQYRASGGVIDPAYGALAPYSCRRLHEFVRQAEPLVATVGVRGC